MTDTLLFDRQLRGVIERAFDRELASEGPMTKLRTGRLTREEAIRWWRPEVDNLLFFTEVVAPHLMQTCPDVDARIALWHRIFIVFGRGKTHRAHPYLLQRFLAALGAPTDDLDGVLRRDARMRERVEAVQRLGFVEAMLTEFLAPASAGAMVYRAIGDTMRHQFGLDAGAVSYFEAMANEGPRTMDALIRLAVRYCPTDEQQTLALRRLAEPFTQPPLAWVTCSFRREYMDATDPG